MIDIQLIRDNPEYVKQNSRDKGCDIDVYKILKLDRERRALIEYIDLLRQVHKIDSQVYVYDKILGPIIKELKSESK